MIQDIGNHFFIIDLAITYKGFTLGDYISSNHDVNHENAIFDAVETIDQFLKNVCIKIGAKYWVLEWLNKKLIKVSIDQKFCKYKPFLN